MLPITQTQRAITVISRVPLTNCAISRSLGNLLPRSEMYLTSPALICAIPVSFVELLSTAGSGDEGSGADDESPDPLFLFFLFFLSE